MGREEKSVSFQLLVPCHPRLVGSIYRQGAMQDEKVLYLMPCPKSNVGISKHTVQPLQSCTSVLEFEVLAGEKHLLSCLPSPPLHHLPSY